MGEEVESWDEPGGHISIVYDEGEYANPRENSNVGTIVAYHPKYTLGDETSQSIDFKAACPTCAGESKGPAGEACLTCRGEGEIQLDPETYFRQARGARVVIPLGLYDHSGISIHCADGVSPSQSDQWDTSRVGFIFDTPEGVKACMGDDPTDEEVEAALRSEVESYDTYLKGEVYGFIVTNHQNKEDSCFGFLGDLEYVRHEAVSALESLNELPPRTIP